MEDLQSNQKCRVCEQMKPFSAFNKKTANKSGFQTICRICESAKKADYYSKNKEQIKTKARTRYDDNKEQSLATQKKYRQTHSETLAKAGKKFRQANPEIVKARRIKYRDSHRSEITARNAATKIRRRLAKSGISTMPGTDERIKELKLNAVFCYHCAKLMAFGTESIEHLIPLVLGGAHSPDNIVASCLSCNSSKRDKLPVAWWIYQNKMELGY